MNNQSKTMFALLAVAIAAVFIANTVFVTTTEAFAGGKKLAELAGGKKCKCAIRSEAAPAAT